MAKKHFYYVTCQYRDRSGSLGMSALEISSTEPITSAEHVNKFRQAISETLAGEGSPVQQMVVTNWILLRTERGD